MEFGVLLHNLRSKKRDWYHLLLAADKVPSDILAILREYPDESIALLRERFG